jgi:pyrroline-5-carboxylate reductase
MSEIKSLKVAFIGCGNMGEAILKRLIDREIISADDILISTKTLSRQKHLVETFGVHAISVDEIAQRADLIVLAIKPQQLEDLSKIKLRSGVVVVSILAGTPVEAIKAKFNGLVVRAMPNLGFQAGYGLTGLYFDNSVAWKKTQIQNVETLFASGGLTMTIMDEEQKINAVTAISGSGSAYYYWLSETLVKAAQGLGFTETESNILVRQTLLGAAEVLKTRDENLKELRNQVTSKGGTTEAAISVLKNSDAETVIQESVKAALKRAEDLSTSDLPN